MNKRYWLGGLLLLMCGCSSMNHTEQGALTGGIFGAAAGTILGGLAGDPGAGAAIGAGAGALLGGVAGNEQDKAERRADMQAQAIANQNPPLALNDVVRMVQQHISDDVIINQIRSTNSVYQLRANEITFLKQQGVSDRVIMEMQNRRTAVVVPRTPVYVVDPGPPPVSVGIGYGWGRRCW